MTAITSVMGLSVTLRPEDDDTPLLRNVTFEIGAREAVALVGESGSGKSLTAAAILGILPTQASWNGCVVFNQSPVFAMSSEQLRMYRRHEVGIVMQRPGGSLNPVRRIRTNFTEGQPRDQQASVLARAKTVLKVVGIEDPEWCLNAFPHTLSGGMQQRVAIARAIMGQPKLLIADEATTALDVTTQSEVVRLLKGLREEEGMALLFVSHDLDLAASLCDRVVVMYGGSVVEDQPIRALASRALHPYTAGLLKSRLGLEGDQSRLTALPGRPASPRDRIPGCRFAPRCRFATDVCHEFVPELSPLGAGVVACHHATKLLRDPYLATVASGATG